MIHFAADDGEQIHVHVTGSGPPLVMLHGWTASHAEWRMFIKELACHHRLYLWDARGHGGHPLHVGTTATLSRMAHDLRQMLEYFELTDASLVAHSMGALTAWEYVRQFGTAGLARICVIDQSPKLVTDSGWALGIYGDFDAVLAAQFMQELRTDFVETVLRLSAHGLNIRARASYAQNSRGWQRERERLAQLAPAPLIDIWDSLTQADLRTTIPKINLPALLIHGECSNFYPLKTADYLHAQMPNAALQIYGDTDHNPHLWQPTRFLRDLLTFTKQGRC